MKEPLEWKYGSAQRFFADFFKYKQDKKKNGDRTRFINALITADRLVDAGRLWFVWFMDNRGRLYSRSGQINYIFSSLYRAMLKFDESCPIKGRETEMAWAIGGAVGIEPDSTARNDYLMECGERIAEVGRDPLGNVPYWDTLKDPWKFIQLARDWASYVDDEDARTSTPYQLDQTCSGFGHLACLTRDQRLAENVCIVGTDRRDLYKTISDLTEIQVRMKLEEAIHTGDEHTQALAKCWLGFWPDRSMFKAATMPVVYGRAYVTLSLIVGQYLRDELKHFKYGDLRIVELGNWLAGIIHTVTKDYLPGAGDLGRWLKLCGEQQLAIGQPPHWITPNGLVVTCKEMIKVKRKVSLRTGSKSVVLRQFVEEGATLNTRVKASRIAADFIHSMDAAFCQNVILRWKETGRPIVTVHDCFATTLEHVPALHELLLDEWHKFYQTDWLSAHRSMVMIETGARIPEPPIVGDLELAEVGSNPFLFG
jgi:DNA-directed RNA polymerase